MYIFPSKKYPQQKILNYHIYLLVKLLVQSKVSTNVCQSCFGTIRADSFTKKARDFLLKFMDLLFWLVVSTPLKNMNVSWDEIPKISGKIKLMATKTTNQFWNGQENIHNTSQHDPPGVVDYPFGRSSANDRLSKARDVKSQSFHMPFSHEYSMNNP